MLEEKSYTFKELQALWGEWENTLTTHSQRKVAEIKVSNTDIRRQHGIGWIYYTVHFLEFISIKEAQNEKLQKTYSGAVKDGANTTEGGAGGNTAGEDPGDAGRKSPDKKGGTKKADSPK